jgi:hypothetical protein
MYETSGDAAFASLIAAVSVAMEQAIPRGLAARPNSLPGSPVP